MQNVGVEIDTTPIITQYGVKNPSGNPSSKPFIEDATCCVTKIYRYTANTTARQRVNYYGCNGNALVYTNDTYTDYWSLVAISGSEGTSGSINISSDGMSFTLATSLIDDSYAYMQESGEILFAGKNTIYYGHRNTSELN